MIRIDILVAYSLASTMWLNLGSRLGGIVDLVVIKLVEAWPQKPPITKVFSSVGLDEICVSIFLNFHYGTLL